VRQVPVVVVKVDRLTRSVAFLSRLLDEAGDVRFADLPMIEGATGKFLLQQMAAVAELEAGMISARTKAALAAAKRRGVKLGDDMRSDRFWPHRVAGRISAGMPLTTSRATAISRPLPAGPWASSIQISLSPFLYMK
jgi:hypothetical protein